MWCGVGPFHIAFAFSKRKNGVLVCCFFFFFFILISLFFFFLFPLFFFFTSDILLGWVGLGHSRMIGLGRFSLLTLVLSLGKCHHFALRGVYPFFLPSFSFTYIPSFMFAGVEFFGVIIGRFFFSSLFSLADTCVLSVFTLPNGTLRQVHCRVLENSLVPVFNGLRRRWVSHFHDTWCRYRMFIWCLLYIVATCMDVVVCGLNEKIWCC